MVNVSRSEQTKYVLTLPVAFVCLVAISACTLRLVSDYDDHTDVAVSELQSKVDTFLVGLEKNSTSPGCTYDHNKQFYVDVTVAVSSLTIRNEGRPKNDITVQQLALLSDSLQALEKLHAGKGGKCMLEVELEPIRTGMNTSFGAILKFELAKKRGR